MEQISPFWGMAAGIFAGLVFTQFVSRWAMALYCAKTGKSISKDAKDSSSPAPKPTPVLPVFFLHSGFWVVLLVVISTLSVFVHAHAAWWNWFFGALYVTPFAIVALAFVALQRTRRRKRDTNAA